MRSRRSWTFSALDLGPRRATWQTTAAPGEPYKLQVLRCLQLRIERQISSYDDAVTHDYLRLRKRPAPSRHSGLSSLSPKDPNNSDTKMSAGSGTSIDLMSPKRIFTESPHSNACFSCRLELALR
jgi:hypothetical protein